MTEPKIKVATSEDIPLLSQLSMDTFREAWLDNSNKEDLEYYVRENFSFQTIEAELNDPSMLYFIAFIDEKAAGYCKMQLNKSPDEVKLESALALHRIYVYKQFQNKGIGSLLLDMAINIARKENLKYIWLGVWNENTAGIRFYERAGFRKMGNYKFIMGNTVSDDYLMGLELI